MILLDSVTKKYPGDKLPALDNISLHIEPNEFVFLVGKSGAGKSTLMKMLTKEETPDTGKIIVGGIDLDYVKKRNIPNYRRRLGVVFQDFKLLPRRTVYENVAFALEIAGMSGREIRNTVPKVLELVDLLDQAKKFPDQLSGGQQQRVSIARSVARQPKILIADEPTANLDKLTTDEIIALLKKINDFGTTILVTTHNENIVNNLQKRVITMEDGRIINDQKNNGIYKLDETPVQTNPVRTIRTPGHALQHNINDVQRVHPTTHTTTTRISSPTLDAIRAQRQAAAAQTNPARASRHMANVARVSHVIRKPVSTTTRRTATAATKPASKPAVTKPAKNAEKPTKTKTTKRRIVR